MDLQVYVLLHILQYTLGNLENVEYQQSFWILSENDIVFMYIKNVRVFKINVFFAYGIQHIPYRETIQCSVFWPFEGFFT